MCLRLLQALHAARPNHRLMAADFSELPDVQIPGRNAPLVSTTVNGAAAAALVTVHPWRPNRADRTSGWALQVWLRITARTSSSLGLPTSFSRPTLRLCGNCIRSQRQKQTPLLLCLQVSTMFLTSCTASPIGRQRQQCRASTLCWRISQTQRYCLVTCPLGF